MAANQSGFSRTNFSKNNTFDGGLIHAGVSRYRVTGTGIFRLTMNSLDDIQVSTLPTVTLAAATAIEPTVLSNFISQRICLVFTTTNINEQFLLTRMTVYVKQVATGIPQ